MKCRFPKFDSRTSKPRGFSFTEILFAVMILGIGFIMVAAMFPVAIRQTEANNRETITASVGRSSSSYMNRVAAIPWPPGAAAGAPTQSLLVPTTVGVPSPFMMPAGQSSFVFPGQVWTMFDSRDTANNGAGLNHNLFLWQSVSNNLILPADPRFGWVVLYKRDVIATGPPGVATSTFQYAPSAQIIMIGLEAANKPAYSLAADVPTNPTAPRFTPFLPQRLAAQINRSAATGFSTIQFTSAAPQARLSPVEGAYVVISDDALTVGTPQHGAFNGRIFRLGAMLTAPPRPQYQLLPGSDMTAGDTATMATLGITSPLTVTVLVVGRSPITATTFAGPAQDVAVYTTYVQTN